MEELRIMQTYLIFAVLLWWVIEWIKRYLVRFEVPDKVREIIVLILALVGGFGLAFVFDLDLLVMLGVQEVASDVGRVFGGFGIASGSGGVYELLKAIKNIGVQPETPPDKTTKETPKG
jgi:hypothetical protein